MRAAWFADRHAALASRAHAARLLAASRDLPPALAGELHLARAQVLLALADDAEADRALAAAEAAAPWSFRAALARGEAALLAGRPDHARVCFTEAAARAPGRVEPILAGARAALADGRVADALETLRAAVRAHPSSSDAALALARLLALREETDDALAALAAAPLDDTARAALHRDPAFDALRGDPTFRRLAGDLPPDALDGPGERPLGGAGGSAYHARGELIE
ncbi:MAG: tetratricopeptide repeat protein [Planctomycetes bacterium]|nr:tetratricopeptide repeat protein [Planctomycetota bacterium]